MRSTAGFGDSCFAREKTREIGITRDAPAHGERVSGLAGGQGGIRTRGSCLMLASLGASKEI